MLALAVRDILVAASLQAHLTARVPGDTDPTVIGEISTLVLQSQAEWYMVPPSSPKGILLTNSNSSESLTIGTALGRYPGRGGVPRHRFHLLSIGREPKGEYLNEDRSRGTEM